MAEAHITSPRTPARPGPSAPAGPGGFSIVELVVTILIMAILIAIAVPTYMSVVPRAEVKDDARVYMFLLQRARMAASNYQRPVRVLLDCTPATLGGGRRPCRLEAQVPLFDSAGVIKSWRRLDLSDAELHPATQVSYRNPADASRTKTNFVHYQNLFEGFLAADGSGGPRSYGVYGKDAFASDSFVVVFTPGGEAVTNCPIDLRFANTLLGDRHNWRLTVVNSTGHIRLKGCQAADCLS
jgi:prepilin-type N-terminal cleavage/methylation domain-containing protein